MPRNEGADEDWMREQAIVTAAMIAVRDGDTELRAKTASIFSLVGHKVPAPDLARTLSALPLCGRNP